MPILPKVWQNEVSQVRASDSWVSHLGAGCEVSVSVEMQQENDMQNTKGTSCGNVMSLLFIYSRYFDW